MRSLAAALMLAFAASALGQAAGSALDRAYAEVVVARAALQKAEEARQQGEEPLAGDRQGVVAPPFQGQHSRLSDQYWQRQKQLEQGVEQARKNLDEALKRWNALK